MRTSLWITSVVTVFLSTIALSSAHAADRYQIILNRMQALHAKYPATTSIFSIGENDDGVAIQAMRVSTSPLEVDKSKIGQIVVSTHHGNELAAPEFTLYFLEELLKRYNSRELFRGNLAEQEWTIIPVLNIPGYNVASRYEHSKDPNRDYPGPCISATGGKLKSIRTLMSFVETRNFVGSLTVHGYAGALTYPWGVSTSNTHTSDHNQFEKITQKAAALNGYQFGTSTDIVYPCDGAYEDYMYWKFGTWSLLLELRNGDSNDIKNTSLAMGSYFDQLDSSNSSHNQMTGQCSRNHRPDLARE